MKYTLLDNKSVADVKKRISIHIAITLIAVLVAVSLNILLSIFRSETTHVAFLVINIMVDLFSLWFTVFIVDNVIAPERRLFRLYSRLEYGEKFDGKVINISEGYTRVCGISCYAVDLDGGRRIFVTGNNSIKQGFVGTFTLVDNIVVEVTDE